MRNILLRVFINTASLWIVDKIFTDIWFQDTNALFITAIIFGLLNTFIKPVLVIFTLPINLLSLGLFTVIINAVILKLADYWVDNFFVDGFGTAILASLFISVISIILNSILKDK
jgi:putative membrane protein